MKQLDLGFAINPYSPTISRTSFTGSKRIEWPTAATQRLANLSQVPVAEVQKQLLFSKSG
jgi:hypothetical protein